MSESADQRRLRRQKTLQIRRFSLGAEPDDDLSDVTTAAERVAMVWTLARRTWALMGEELPSYPRAKIPGRLIRSPDADPG